MNRPPGSVSTAWPRSGLEGHAIERAVLIHTGRCFREWRRSFEMHLAARILCICDVPIKAVAYDLAYRSPRAFARAFRAVTGMTPSEYRQRYRRTSSGSNG